MPEDQPEVEVTVDPRDPTLYRFRVLLRDVDPALVEQLGALSALQSDLHHVEPLVSAQLPLPLPRPPPGNVVREVRLGPLEIKVDLKPFMRVMDLLHSSFQNLVEKFTGPELVQLIEDLTEGRKKPGTEFEHLIARSLMGPTRFERINEDED
jgi:hypothetical protein